MIKPAHQMEKYIAEGLGTFILVFAGTGAIVFNDISGGSVTHVGVALTFGLVVLTIIYTFGEVSGAHINPAVTIGFWLAKRLSGRDTFCYILSQVIGACCASASLSLLVEHHPTYGATLPSGTVLQSFILEVILTWWLMLVILNVSHGAKEKGIVAGLVVGAVVAFEAMFAGPISGASMNPARSLAPAVISGQLYHVWVYLCAPTLGALLAVVTCKFVHTDKCCQPIKVNN